MSKHTLTYVVINGTLYVAHPEIMPHAIKCIDGKWYCYPISPDAEVCPVEIRNVQRPANALQTPDSVGNVSGSAQADA